MGTPKPQFKRPPFLPVLVLLAIAHLAGGGKITPPLVPPQPKPGVKLVLLIHESEQDTPELARAIVALRNPPHSDTIKAGGHTLDILDPDTKDQDGKPSALITAYKAQIDGQPLPLLLTIDKGTGAAVRNKVDPKAGAVEIMAALKANGV